eukprot:1237202-Rhodomonas_salina.1
MNLCLRLLDDAGVGYRHACRERCSHAAFVDDQVLVTQSPEDMNVLLEQLRMELDGPVRAQMRSHS